LLTSAEMLMTILDFFRLSSAHQLQSLRETVAKLRYSLTLRIYIELFSISLPLVVFSCVAKLVSSVKAARRLLEI
jgi:hypothetical protein